VYNVKQWHQWQLLNDINGGVQCNIMCGNNNGAAYGVCGGGNIKAYDIKRMYGKRQQRGKTQRSGIAAWRVA